MLLEHAHSTLLVAQRRSEDALRAAAAHRRAREARTLAAGASRRARHGLRPRRANPGPCAEAGVLGSMRVALGLQERCA
jgi:hypothetical protein